MRQPVENLLLLFFLSCSQHIHNLHIFSSFLLLLLGNSTHPVDLQSSVWGESGMHRSGRKKKEFLLENFRYLLGKFAQRVGGIKDRKKILRLRFKILKCQGIYLASIILNFYVCICKRALKTLESEIQLVSQVKSVLDSIYDATSQQI